MMVRLLAGDESWAGDCGPGWKGTYREIVMPRRDDIRKILVIGSGPIVIGQACEFDYSGSQACK
ncbi:MAG TPA: hypothetical protein P5568_12055, partial [Acidobacteriota bacterium]|nr:hypothetical protein [Acidobacteriota bacterium]